MRTKSWPERESCRRISAPASDRQKSQRVVRPDVKRRRLLHAIISRRFKRSHTIHHAAPTAHQAGERAQGKFRTTARTGRTLTGRLQQRAQELIGVGQQQAALSILHEHVTSKRTRNSTIASLEPVVLLFVELCVDLRKGKAAKDGLYNYKNTSQNTNVATIEVRLRMTQPPESGPLIR